MQFSKMVIDLYRVPKAGMVWKRVKRRNATPSAFFKQPFRHRKTSTPLVWGRGMFDGSVGNSQVLISSASMGSGILFLWKLRYHLSRPTLPTNSANASVASWGRTSATWTNGSGSMFAEKQRMGI